MTTTKGEKRTVKGWMVEHYGMAQGVFAVYHTRQKAEHIIRNLECECVVKPIPVIVTVPANKKKS